MSKKLMLIDANSLLYRAFFALPPLENSAGQPTGAVYGFINMLMKLREDYPTDYIVAAFDLPGPTRRQEQFAEYKAHRPKMPPELRDQFTIAKEVLTALGIPIVGEQGYEADDLVGTLAVRARNEGMFAWIVSGDRDILQVVAPDTEVILTQKGLSQIKLYDTDAVFERYQVEPRQLIDVKALMGDSSDNIPGVPGIGEKTAIKLVSQYGSLENVYEHIEELKVRVRQNLEQYREQAEISRELATIDLAAPVDIEWPPAAPEPDEEKLYQLFKQLEFNTLLERLNLSRSAPEAPQLELETFSEPGEVNALFAGDSVAVLFNAAGFAIGREDRTWLCVEDAAAAVKPALLKFITTEGKTLITDDAKAVHRFALEQDELVRCRVESCQLAGYLLKPGSNLDVPQLVRVWTEGGLDQQPEQADAEYILHHAGLLPRLWRRLESELAEAGLTDLYQEIELPLARVLARMELNGVSVDIRELETIGEELAQRISGLEQEIWSLADGEFNINSPRQLGEVLFDKLGLPPVRKTKTGYSTDSGVLEALQGDHEIIPLVMDYRQLVKLQSTYIDGLKGVWDRESGRIYTTFNQLVTATGRLSSTEPNLQNIPIRLEEGRRIRKAFVAGGGYRWLLAADYSQIELRILAHIAGDTRLVEAFRAGEDIHRHTAAEIFEVAPDQVNDDQRRAAKAVNFGLVYGQTDFGLSQALGISRAKAKAYIDTYFKRYPGVREYMDQIMETAHKQGYVTTLWNRRRYLPEINSRNYQRRSFAERTAINTPIQGSAADIIKLAMVEVERRLDSEGIVTRMLLQVHDELVLEVPDEELQWAGRLVRRAMEQVADLDVPLVADLKYGANWYDMSPLVLESDSNA
ncbi:MAG: DNA polymerase I [Firmicutes bacterium]|nr:DNA polymerase I [Bacillota bacterium]